MTVTINKWGNSLGVRIPKALAEQAQLEVGKEMTISTDEAGRLILSTKKTLTLDDLCAGVTPENRHDLIAKDDDEIGRERWTY